MAQVQSQLRELRFHKLHGVLKKKKEHLGESLCHGLDPWSEVAQSCPTLCKPMNCSLPGSSVHGIFQARVLDWVAISFSRGSSQPRDQTRVSYTAGRRFTVWATREAYRLLICTAGFHTGQMGLRSQDSLTTTVDFLNSIFVSECHRWSFSVYRLIHIRL